MTTQFQHQLNLRPTTKLTSAPAPPRAPVDPNLARVPLSEKLQGEILSSYLRRAKQQDNNNGNYDWNQIVKQASVYATHAPPHTERELKSIVDLLLQQFPSVPRDCNSNQKRQLLNHNRAEHHHLSGSDSAEQQHQQQRQASTSIPHVFDISPRDRLTSRGASMFPPLQKQTPRTSSGHEKFRTAASEQLLSDERHFSPAKPAQPPVVAHHFGKSNSQSPRRQRNTYAINQTFACLNTNTEEASRENINNSARKRQTYDEFKSVVAKVNAILPSDRPVEASTLHMMINLNNKNNNNTHPNGKFKLATQLSSEELERFIADNSNNNNNNSSATRFGSKNNNNNNNSINGSRRFGFYFTSPSTAEGGGNLNKVSSSSLGGSGGDAAAAAAPTILMTDEMMDRLRDKQQQRRTRIDLDAAITSRRQQLDARKAEFQQEKERERQRSAEIARQDAADQAKRLARRKEQQALAEELKLAERQRLDAKQAERRDQHRYAHVADEQNQRGIEEAILTAAVKRHRKEEAARVNLEMAEARRQRRLQDHLEEKQLELKLLSQRKEF